MLWLAPTPRATISTSRETASTLTEAVEEACAAVESVPGLEVMRVEPYNRPDDRLERSLG